MKIKLLDRGYVELCDSWGSDQAIIEAARQSTDKGFIGWGPQHTEQCGIRHTWFKCDCKPKPGDEKLLAYLWDNKHSTPFEFAGISIEVQAPLAVFAEWHRHRTQGYSQHSTRYSPLPSLHYLPTVERCMVKASGNKQAGGDDWSRRAYRRSGHRLAFQACRPVRAFRRGLLARAQGWDPEGSSAIRDHGCSLLEDASDREPP